MSTIFIQALYKYVLQMLANTGGKAEKVKYFTLFDATGIVEGERAVVLGAAVLFVGAVFLFGAAIGVFCKKDLHI